MNNINQQKEAYEVDPNSSFNKLKKLQSALKEEMALSDIYFENRDNLLKKIDKNCFIYLSFFLIVLFNESISSPC